MNLAPRPATADLRATLLTWGPIVAGLAFMYGPSFVDLFRGIWSTDEQAHGPIVLGCRAGWSGATGRRCGLAAKARKLRRRVGRWSSLPLPLPRLIGTERLPGMS